MAKPQMFAPDTPMPPPPDAKLLDVPMNIWTTPGQVRLGWAHGGTAGGYKVPNLIGLAWSAPYLHDGGVAVGSDTRDVGVTGTWDIGVKPDPGNSLRALVDRDLRLRVVAANKTSPRAVMSHVTGEGHVFWVDQAAGYTRFEQNALISFLLSIDKLQD